MLCRPFLFFFSSALSLLLFASSSTSPALVVLLLGAASETSLIHELSGWSKHATLNSQHEWMLLITWEAATNVATIHLYVCIQICMHLATKTPFVLDISFSMNPKSSNVAVWEAIHC